MSDDEVCDHVISNCVRLHLRTTAGRLAISAPTLFLFPPSPPAATRCMSRHPLIGSSPIVQAGFYPNVFLDMPDFMFSEYPRP